MDSTGKSGAPGRLAPQYPPGRLLDLPPFLTHVIRQYLAKRAGPITNQNATADERQVWANGHDLLFPNRDNWNARWRKVCDGWPESPRKQAAEPIIKGLRLHDCKHTHVAMVDDLGTHSVMRDYRLGHATPGTRDVYSHPTVQMRLNLVNDLQRMWEERQRGGFELTA